MEHAHLFSTFSEMLLDYYILILFWFVKSLDDRDRYKNLNNNNIVMVMNASLMQLQKEKNIKLNVYGYVARVYWDGQRFIGRIDELHVTDAAKSIKELEEDLKNAASGLLETALTSKKPNRISHGKI